MDGFTELHLFLTAKSLGDDHTGADADTRKQVYEGRVQQYAGPHCSRSFRAQVIADKEDVNGGI